jgi:hypothetical protein
VNSVDRKQQCERSSSFRTALQAEAEAHWSEDTPGAPPINFACCVLARNRKGVCCVNFPLSTYSVFEWENVSQEQENSWKESRLVVRTSRQTAGFGSLLSPFRKPVQFVFGFSLSCRAARKMGYPEHREIAGQLNQQCDDREREDNERPSE